jgi:uncharacterized protein (TIGR00369 family)
MSAPASVRKPASTAHLDDLKAMQRGEREHPPVAKLLGIALAAIEHARSVTEMTTDPARHANPMGTLHGGIVCDLADFAMGTAMATTLEDGETFTTLDLTAKFFKPIWRARLRAVAEVTKRTRTLGLIECSVEDEGGSLVARLFSSCMVLRGDEAKSR